MSLDAFYYQSYGVLRLKYRAAAVNNTDKRSALVSAVESVVWGDVRCEPHPTKPDSLVLFRGRPGGYLPLSAHSLNKALVMLAEPILSIEDSGPSNTEVAVKFSFSLREWHMQRLWEILGVKNAGYVHASFFGRSVALLTITKRCDRAALRQNLVQAVTAGLTF